MPTEDSVTLSGATAPDPATIGTCKVDARLGHVGQSRLFRGVDVEEARSVCIKLMGHPHDDNPAAVERFLAFATAIVGLAHENVVEVFSAGRDGTAPYVIMELVDGEDLDRALRRERCLVPPAALRAILDAASGLAAGLARGVMHGDVRPGHMIKATGIVKVTGFGLSPPIRTAHGRELYGHPSYLAPEAVLGKPLDHRADIYSLGCVLYELLTGRPPFGLGGPDALLACHVHEPFPTLANQQQRIPHELDAFLAKLVAKTPERRFQSYTELVQAGVSLLPKLRRTLPTEPVLVIEEGRQTGMRLNVPEGQLLLGRSPDEGFMLDDGRVSRRHAIVRRSGDCVEVEDLGSRNGIAVNGIAVKSRQVFAGDRIQVGDTLLRLEGPREEAAPPPMGAAPASPVRGAYGEAEIAHPPQRQAGIELLAALEGSFAQERLALLGQLAPLLAAKTSGPAALREDVLAVVAVVLRADERLYVAVQGGRPVIDAKNAHDAEVLSCTLPAIERALPGQLALATTVRAGAESAWSVALAPVRQNGTLMGLFVLARHVERFVESDLMLLESVCALLTLRADSSAI